MGLYAGRATGKRGVHQPATKNFDPAPFEKQNPKMQGVRHSWCRNFERRFVHFDGDGQGRRAENSKSVQCFRYFTPGHQDFSPSDGNKFKQDLHAEHTSRCEEFFGLRAAWIGLRQGIDQHVRIRGEITHRRVLAKISFNLPRTAYLPATELF
jgi:hypothetical protein